MDWLREGEMGKYVEVSDDIYLGGEWFIFLYWDVVYFFIYVCFCFFRNLLFIDIWYIVSIMGNNKYEENKYIDVYVY